MVFSCVSMHVSACQSVCLSVCLRWWFDVYVYMCLSVSQSVCLSACIKIHATRYRSIDQSSIHS